LTFEILLDFSEIEGAHGFFGGLGTKKVKKDQDHEHYVKKYPWQLLPVI